MADVTAPQFQQDVNNAADWANGDENTTVTMRLGQQADSPAKTIKDIKDAGSEAAGSIQFTVKGAFADGFTIDYYFELGETATGEIYRYKRPNALPFVVPAGFDPTVDGRFEQWVNTDHNNLTNRNADGAHDEIYDRSFDGVSEMIAYTGHQVGLKYCTGSTIWKVKSVPVVDISDFERLNQLNVIDFGAQFGTSDSSAAFLDAAQVDGSSVFVPSGTFNCGTSIDFSQYDFHSVGDVNILNNLTINVKDITKSYRHNGDLLQKIRSQLGIRGMYYYSDASNLFVGIGMNRQLDSVVEYRFEVNPDGLLLIKGGFAGIGDESLSTKTATLNGTFIESSPANGSYTITVGDKVNGSFTGSHFGLNHYGDNRGGIWKITLSNGDSKTYSTWRSSAGVVGFTPIFENLPHGDYTFEMEFLGDDPLNAPSGGTSRGWIRQAASDPSVNSIKFLAVNPLDYSSASDILTQDTIADFAILARPAGTSITSRWVPDHGVAGVSLGNQISVHVDGERILNSSTLVTTPYTACSDFLISQRFTANNPEVGGGNMWDHFVSHSISLDMPWLSINNKLEFTADTRLSQTYLAMMAARKSRCQRFATSDRYIESAPFLDDNSEIALPIGNDSAMMSGVSTFDSNNWHGLISRVSSFQDANGLGDFWGSPENRLWYRSDDTLKFYWKAARFNTDVPAGTIMSCQNDLFVVAGVRFPNTQLRNVM